MNLARLAALACTSAALLACGKNYEAAQPAVEAAPASTAVEEEAVPQRESESADSAKESEKSEALAEDDSAEPGKESAGGPSGQIDFNQELELFEQQMNPSELSCDGAKPHLEAICGIAKRICESSNMLQAKTDCQTAQSSCEKARARFRSKCTG